MKTVFCNQYEAWLVMMWYEQLLKSDDKTTFTKSDPKINTGANTFWMRLRGKCQMYQFYETSNPNSNNGQKFCKTFKWIEDL